MTDIKDKIKKLLSLATSPNENEAKAAMLKAKELMAKNKLSEEDFKDAKSNEIETRKVECIKWTTDSGRIWVTDLCKLIAENYCCGSAWSSIKGRRTYTLELTGFPQDVDLCEEVIKFAMGFIEKRVKIIQRQNHMVNPKSAEASYAKGFIAGLKFAFEDQQEEQENNEEGWGIVMTVPQEVKDYINSLGSKSVKTKQAGFDPMSALQGKKDGMTFSPNKVIGNA